MTMGSIIEHVFAPLVNLENDAMLTSERISLLCLILNRRMT